MEDIGQTVKFFCNDASVIQLSMNKAAATNKKSLKVELLLYKALLSLVRGVCLEVRLVTCTKLNFFSCAHLKAPQCPEGHQPAVL